MNWIAAVLAELAKLQNNPLAKMFEVQILELIAKNANQPWLTQLITYLVDLIDKGQIGTQADFDKVVACFHAFQSARYVPSTK